MTQNLDRRPHLRTPGGNVRGHMPPTTRGQTPALSTCTPRGRARTSPRQDHARDGAQELTRHRSDDRIDRLLFLCLVLGGISGLPHRDTRARATSMSAAFLNVGVRVACARRARVAPRPKRAASRSYGQHDPQAVGCSDATLLPPPWACRSRAPSSLRRPSSRRRPSFPFWAASSHPALGTPRDAPPGVRALPPPAPRATLLRRLSFSSKSLLTLGSPCRPPVLLIVP
jgi:hypothetical protein